MKWIPKIKSIVVGKKAIYYININKKDLGKIISETQTQNTISLKKSLQMANIIYSVHNKL